jgi:hypothetical protein
MCFKCKVRAKCASYVRLKRWFWAECARHVRLKCRPIAIKMIFIYLIHYPPPQMHLLSSDNVEMPCPSFMEHTLNSVFTPDDSIPISYNSSTIQAVFTIVETKVMTILTLDMINFIDQFALWEYVIDNVRNQLDYRAVTYPDRCVELDIIYRRYGEIISSNAVLYEDSLYHVFRRCRIDEKYKDKIILKNMHDCVPILQYLVIPEKYINKVIEVMLRYGRIYKIPHDVTITSRIDFRPYDDYDYYDDIDFDELMDKYEEFAQTINIDKSETHIYIFFLLPYENCVSRE